MIESGFINGDCMDYLKEYPDNYFDLCIADPPYGDAMKSGGGWNRFGQRFNRYKTDTLHLRTPEERSELQEPVEHGRQNTQKNYNMGCCA